jgi:signal transduction histidine kinase
MYSKTGKPAIRTAAWRISMWATVAFACSTLLVFASVDRFVADDIQRRSDAWLSGELGVLGDVAERTSNDRLYGRVVGEIAELASREVPNRSKTTESGKENDSVFFLQEGADGAMKLWVGAGDGRANLRSIDSGHLKTDTPSTLQIDGFRDPFRVASVHMPDGGNIYLGLSQRDELRVLRNLRIRFLLLGLLMVLVGVLIVFYTTRRMLGHVQRITEAASRIGQSDIGSRVPTTEGNDEIGHLALTLNRMLDRIESSVHQLHTITGSLAHDIRSPLTAIRGKLEMVLSTGVRQEQVDPIVSTIDELDRLVEFLDTSLDVAEGKANALRLHRTEIDLNELLGVMLDLYEPSMSERDLKIERRSATGIKIFADAALLHRMIANLLDNELKHLPSGCSIWIGLDDVDDRAVLVVEDDGPGFDPDVMPDVFGRGVKGNRSKGRGLGLAFVEAVVRAHGGSVTASNRAEGGAMLDIRLPLERSLALNDSPASLQTVRL